MCLLSIDGACNFASLCLFDIVFNKKFSKKTKLSNQKNLSITLYCLKIFSMLHNSQNKPLLFIVFYNIWLRFIVPALSPFTLLSPKSDIFAIFCKMYTQAPHVLPSYMLSCLPGKHSFIEFVTDYSFHSFNFITICFL